MSSVSPFQVEQLRTRNLIASVQAVGVFLLALFVTAFGPSLLLRYVYANQDLMEQPVVLEWLPVICFAVGVGYFLYVMATNMAREKQAQKMEKEVVEMGCDCDCCGCDCEDCEPHHHDHGTMASDSLSQAMKKSDSKTKKTVRKV